MCAQVPLCQRKLTFIDVICLSSVWLLMGWRLLELFSMKFYYDFMTFKNFCLKLFAFNTFSQLLFRNAEKKLIELTCLPCLKYCRTVNILSVNKRAIQVIQSARMRREGCFTRERRLRFRIWLKSLIRWFIWMSLSYPQVPRHGVMSDHECRRLLSAALFAQSVWLLNVIRSSVLNP